MLLNGQADFLPGEFHVFVEDAAYCLFECRIVGQRVTARRARDRRSGIERRCSAWCGSIWSVIIDFDLEIGGNDIFDSKWWIVIHIIETQIRQGDLDATLDQIVEHRNVVFVTHMLYS